MAVIPGRAPAMARRPKSSLVTRDLCVGVLAAFAWLGMDAARPQAAPPQDRADAGQPIATARLLTEARAVVPGRPFVVGLHLDLPQGWHTYWRNPGDAGAPTTLSWRLPAGFAAGPVAWPRPERIEQGEIVSYGYHDEVLLMVEIAAPDDLPPEGWVEIALDAEWLVCAEICVPEYERFELRLPVAQESASSAAAPAVAAHDEFAQDAFARDAFAHDAFARARARLPRPAPGPVRYRLAGDEIVLALPAAAQRAWSGAPKVFFPHRYGAIEHRAPQIAAAGEDGPTLRMVRDANAGTPTGTLAGVLVLGEAPDDVAYRIDAEPAAPASSTVRTEQKEKDNSHEVPR
jgi:thiol:disulfide interchange protein DsbD